MIAIGQQPTPGNGALWLRPPVQPPNTDPLRPLVMRVGAQPVPASSTAWLRTVRETPISALLLPYDRHTYRVAAAPAATIPAVGRRFSVPADTESEQL